MFWKLVLLALALWAVGMYFAVTLGGLIHLLPAGAMVCLIVRRVARRPDTEYGRWRPATERAVRR